MLIAGGAFLVTDMGGKTAASSYQEAQQYIKTGDLRAARVALMNAVKEDPKFGQALLAQARVCLDLFDAPAAQDALERAQLAGVNKDQTAHLLGHAYWLQGEWDAAERLLKSPSIPQANRPYALRILGRVQMDRGDLAAAQGSFDEAIRLSPNDSQIWTDVARLRFVQGDQRGAIDAVEYAFKRDPRNVRALEFRGRLMRTQFGVVAALPWFERGLQINPNDIPLLEEYALTLGDAGRYRDMLAQTRALLALDPNNAKAYYAQAVLAARAGNYALASRILAKTGSTLGDMPAAILLGAICELELGNFNRAVDQLQILLGRQPRNRQVRTLLALAMYRAGDPLGSLDIIREIASRPDADTYSLKLTALAFVASNQPERATNPIDDAAIAAIRTSLPLPEPETLDSAARAARQDPDNAQTILPYIRLLAAQGDIETALNEALRLQAGNGGVADAHIIVGDLEMARANLPAAIVAFQKARQISFTEPVMLRLVDALSMTGREDEARETLAAFLAYNPTNLSALRLAGYRNLDARNWDQAIILLERVRGRLGNNDAILLANLARAYSGARHHAKAVHFAEIAYHIAPANAMVTHIYGQALLQQGRRPKAAKELLQKAVILMPENTQVAAAFRRAQAAYRMSAKRQ
ncbi:tetratricopeptide repeat protein [Sphingorhabdus profundilacus]|nr:tetratricopeptide repeat protein [Sphingorhabdus profundilacus]